MPAHGAVSQVVNGPELGEIGVRIIEGIWGQNDLKKCGIRIKIFRIYRKKNIRNYWVRTI